MAAPIEERFIEVDGIRTFLRERPGAGIPAVFLHGNPTNSADWLPFLEAVEGPGLAPDLPCFGSSERPPGDRFDATMGSYGRFCGELLDQLAPGDFDLVVHDWGAVGLLAAQERAERLRRLVVINSVPLRAGYRWHWIARLWRRRGIGEAFNRISSRAGTERILRLARPGRRPFPPEFVDMVWDNFDAGTGRAVLALYRSADPAVLEAAGEHLDRLRGPALVLWGSEDPYLGAEEGRQYERRLVDSTLIPVPRAGHWPWIDRPEVVTVVRDFLASGKAPEPGSLS